MGRVSVAGGTGLLALTNGNMVSCIDCPSNDVARTWNSLDKGSLVMYSEIRTTPDAIYATGLANSKAAYALHATSLFIDNGSTIASVNITENLAKHIVGCMPDIGLAWSGQFIASYRNGSAHVLRYSGKSLRLYVRIYRRGTNPAGIFYIAA
ncbi:hypothetical protein BKA82DRAFT_28097 [Pisolithus tinctorius]|uniref:Uncharacterized protein n=1 Tax=Pisolithus tinctorius Marx 270 TaxID=870435 RepID=A0A0C3JXN2_PISTI|nr:hypothetical protein BKA82DRAFT_28097 [Pisolithus tinctorius]KIO02177.1 hypothetical protein M404DRAFT_28097 [Pisolithus tinctorius Marx 270]